MRTRAPGGVRRVGGIVSAASVATPATAVASSFHNSCGGHHHASAGGAIWLFQAAVAPESTTVLTKARTLLAAAESGRLDGTHAFALDDQACAMG